MKVSLKHFYDAVKRILGLKDHDYWDNNPFVVH